MFSFFRSSQPAPLPWQASVHAMGKIPSYPEFVHGPRAWEPAQSFEAWLDTGTGAMEMHCGTTFETYFDQGAIHGFTWRAPHDARTDGILCGVLFPSRDSVGRHFPLAVMTEVPYAVIGASSHVLPLAVGDFLDQAYDAAAASLHDGPERFTECIKTVAAPRVEDWLLAAAEYEQWCNGTVLGEAWSGLYAESPLDSALATIDALARTFSSVRGMETPAFGPSVRLPLGQAGSAAASLWLDIVRRLCRWQKTIPTAFWSDSALLISSGDAEPRALTDLWRIDPTTSTVCDLTSCPERSFDVSMTNVTANVYPDGSVADFLNSLSWWSG